jgi:17beta-estradiol 17-dehydrogenase/3beta-hydroxysteroid 3-dehydrogenase
MRFVGVTSQNISGYRGAVADAFVALTPLSSLNTTLRYLAATDRWGTSFVEEHPLDIDISTAKELIRKCELAYQAHRHKLP